MRSTTNIQIICKLQPESVNPYKIMKKYMFLLFLALGLDACYDDGYQDTNLIPDTIINAQINLNLPASQNLLIPRQFVVYPNIGHRGVIVFNTGEGAQSINQYLAFDLACPHIAVNSCAGPMDIENFPEMKNSCATDGIFYNFELGYSISYTKDDEGNQMPIEGTVYDLQQYRAELVSPTELRITNF